MNCQLNALHVTLANISMEIPVIMYVRRDSMAILLPIHVKTVMYRAILAQVLLLPTAYHVQVSYISISNNVYQLAPTVFTQNKICVRLVLPHVISAMQVQHLTAPHVLEIAIYTTVNV